MTVYEVLDEIKWDSESTVADYTRRIHNAPFLDYGPNGSAEGEVLVCTRMMEIFTKRVAAISAALAALPVEVAESEV